MADTVDFKPVERAFTLKSKAVLEYLEVTEDGLSNQEATKRRAHFGPNLFPLARPKTILKVFIQQFKNPLIYILLIAAGISISVGDETDAIFIAVVLLINAIIGTIQEIGAEKSALALRQMSTTKALVLRDGKQIEIDAADLVPGDIVSLESGNKVPADLRLISTKGFEVDESLLTGESLAVLKNHDEIFEDNSALGDRKNMAYMSSLVTKGRGAGIVTATALNTELGKIAESLTFEESAKPPLITRMEEFTKKIAVVLMLFTLLMGGYLLYLQHPWQEVMMFCVALAVAAIPEGLPVALTVALSVASRKMARRNVIVRKLPAVEALGSCTFIATDKTGTLTINQLTVSQIILPNGSNFSVTGTGFEEGVIESEITPSVKELLRAGYLCNEANLEQDATGKWTGQGDAVDVAFLVLARKGNIKLEDIRTDYQLIDSLPFEPENQYAATIHQFQEGSHIVSVKGAVEKVLNMCTAISNEKIIQQSDELAEGGFRVLALAGKELSTNPGMKESLDDLIFYGLVGMMDPLRPAAKEAIENCHRAGIKVAMVTGDHPKTALAIARQLELADKQEEVISGPELKIMSSAQEKNLIINKAKVFARVEPTQKLEIVRHLIQGGEFVGVTGDGANDAPALKIANVGVAMGKSGTDVAKETADLILTDDSFASIVAGVEEGRIAYGNIRKVVYLLISTGAAEMLMFGLSLLYNTPLPLTAIQLLWLNLVTNGIQHIGLAFEPGEGDELSRPPRKPDEPVFDRLMIERVIISAAVIGIFSFMEFKYLIDSGVDIHEARNSLLLLMVLFENMMVGNCRSETKSIFSINLLSNKILLFGTLGAQLLHIASMYIPGLNQVLGIRPVELGQWARLLLIASSVLVIVEIYKFIKRKFMASDDHQALVEKQSR